MKNQETDLYKISQLQAQIFKILNDAKTGKITEEEARKLTKPLEHKLDALI